MVELRKIVGALQAVSQSASYYYDRERDAVVEFTTDVTDYETRTMFEDAEFDSVRFVLIESDEYFEYEVMAAFIQTLDDPALVNKLECAVNRRGAAKHFRNTVLGACKDKEWSEFRAERYRSEARHICEAYGIPFE